MTRLSRWCCVEVVGKERRKRRKEWEKEKEQIEKAMSRGTGRGGRGVTCGGSMGDNGDRRLRVVTTVTAGASCHFIHSDTCPTHVCQEHAEIGPVNRLNYLRAKGSMHRLNYSQ